jgi:Glutathione S-transferase, N-terminal domain
MQLRALHYIIYVASFACGAAFSMTAVKFITNKMCPYAQRTWIALEEAQLPYELVEISLVSDQCKYYSIYVGSQRTHVVL